MNHDETVDAIRRSLVVDDAKETHHGVYPKRPAPKLESPFEVEMGPEDPDFPGCYW